LSSSGSTDGAPARRAASRLRSVVAAFLTLLALSALSAALYLTAIGLEWERSVARPLPLPEAGARYVVAPGQGLWDVARGLAREGILPDPLPFVWLAVRSGNAARLQAGEYHVAPGANARELLHSLVTGKVLQHSFTIVEGWTFEQMLAALARQGAASATLAGLEPSAVMERVGAPGLHPEGRFLPETYRFPRGTPDVEILRRAYRHMAAFLAESWEGRDPEVPLRTPDEALALASIVEKETAQPDERRRVAGVLSRRLQRRMPLQADPTVIYGLGSGFTGDLRRQDLQRDSPYNTYTRRGLPPSPIALPGRVSVLAALHPQPGDELFFVARGDGSHHFSAGLVEHERAVARFQSPRRSARAPEPAGGAAP
jgi:UPF0755 protein